MTSYKFLSTGELEIPTRAGFKLVGGCSCRGVFEFNDRLSELQSALAEAPKDSTIHDLYLENERFRFLCDRCLELNAIDPDWIRPHDLAWLLFGHLDADGNPILGHDAEFLMQCYNDPQRPDLGTYVEPKWWTSRVVFITGDGSTPVERGPSLPDAAQLAAPYPRRPGQRPETDRSIIF